MKKLKVALLGIGTVGGGTYRILTEHRAQYKKTHGLDIEVVKVLARTPEKARRLNVPEDAITQDIESILNDGDIDVVCELMGGIEPAKTYILRALNAGKTVVSANKELFAKHWKELDAVAKSNKAGLYFEASCVGGVPIIRTLTEGTQANKIKSIKGIINGTTNYILSQMSEKGTAFGDALKSAQELGFAEADSTADVEGFDACYKLSILSTLAYNKIIPPEKIFREGISKLSVADIKYGRDLGLTLKLLAVSKCEKGKIEARVHPAFIPDSHPLAAVGGSYNAVLVQGDSVGDIMLYGRGAGALPTGSAVVSDILYAATQHKHRYFAADAEVAGRDLQPDFESEYYVRLTVEDKCGILSRISGVFGKCNVSITSVMQKEPRTLESEGVPIVFVTHLTGEQNVRRALKIIEGLDGVIRVNAVIRVER